MHNDRRMRKHHYLGMSCTMLPENLHLNAAEDINSDTDTDTWSENAIKILGPDLQNILQFITRLS